jgi:hypothetical protein
MFILMVGGIRYAVEFLLPAMGTIVVYFYLQNYEADKLSSLRSMIVDMVLCLSTGIGYGIYLYICSTHHVVNTENNSLQLVQSFQEVWDNIQVAVVACYNNFGFSGDCTVLSILGLRSLISLAVCTLLIFILPIMLLKRYKQLGTV